MRALLLKAKCMKFWLTYHDMTKYKTGKIAYLYVDKSPLGASSYSPVNEQIVIRKIFQFSAAGYTWKIER
jgi:hypothetical protein